MKQRIVFFGSGTYTIPIIDVLKQFDLRLIVTTDQGEETGRYASELKKYLAEQTTPVLISNLKSQEDQEKIKELNPTIGVLASYGAILPKNVIELFPNGILNVHPSLLPKFKGPTPIQTTILENELASGVTIIKLDDQVDHGPIVEQGTVQLKGTETTQDLKNYLFGQGAHLIQKILSELETGEPLITHAQDHSQESFTQKITKKNGEIDLQNLPDPGTLDRMIRAYYPWPGVWFIYYEDNIFPERSETKSKDYHRKPSALEGKLIKLLPEQKIQVEGKKPITVKDFKNGYKEENEIIQKLNLPY